MIHKGTKALFQSEALSLLERLPEGEVALIYMDPPWNTQDQRGIPKKTKEETSFKEYVDLLAKIVQQARRLLTEQGSLFVHWYPYSLVDIRLVSNQIFKDQPKYEITWHKKAYSFQDKGGPKNDSEFLLVYSKSQTPTYNAVFRPLTSEESSAYGFSDSRGKYRLVDLTVPFDRPNAQYMWKGITPSLKRSWRFSLEKMENLLKEDMIHFPVSGGVPRMKQYLSDQAGIEVGTIWNDIPAVNPRSSQYYSPFSRPIALIERIISLATFPEEQVLDPFCGSGTTLVSAQKLGRPWWGADLHIEAFDMIKRRLESDCGIVNGKDFKVYMQNEVLDHPILFARYQEVLSNVQEIESLQTKVKTLTKHIVNLKNLIKIPEDAPEEQVEATIKEMQNLITTTLSHQSLDTYIKVVCTWLTGWDRLEKDSMSFLPQAEMLFDNIANSDAEDYSPFIIQYCRALENEILIKLFAAYTVNVSERMDHMASHLNAIDKNDRTFQFAKSLKDGKATYTLGQMTFILNMLKEGGSTLGGSTLLQDFRDFTLRYFSEQILDKKYLAQVDKINSDFRRKAAHPYILDADVARRCRDQVRQCLNELILNYRREGQSNID